MLRQGFTLVELVIVVLILGILAAVALPTLFSSSEDATEIATASVVNTVRDAVDLYFAEHGVHPESIDLSMLRGRLSNPYDPTHPTPVFVANNPANLYPTWKILRPGSTMWYNKANGQFAARVAPQSTDAETIDLYNRVNNHDITALNQTN
jgi:prepilin-type N-terminal cleavage/methylation domain-containing protein